ncbi:MAG: inositol monophosphatase family protein [Qipengyuania sp.]
MNGLDAQVAALLRQVAHEAVMPRYRNLRDSEIIEKATDDLVTVADREAEKMLSEGLADIMPQAAVVGEEAAFADATVLKRLSGLCWIIDPIDGTSNFASGSGHFALMVALAEAGEAQAGWIYDPRRGRMCTATRGAGAHIDGERFHSRPSGHAPPTLAAMTRYMTSGQRSVFEREIAPRYTLVSAPGCAAEQYPLTAFGEHDIAIYERTLAWDHAAGALFLNEAGGKCARQDGSAYRVDSDRKGMIAAATPPIWEEFVSRLDRSGYRPGD